MKEAVEARAPRGRAGLKLALKVLVSVVLLWLLVRKLPGGDFWRAAARADLVLLGLAFAVTLSRAGLWGERFRFLLAAEGLTVGWWSAVRAYFVGFFASLGLPTVVGGDVVRFVWIHREVGRGADLATVVLFERAAGLASVCGLTLPLLLASDLLSDRPAARLALAVFAGSVILGFVLLVTPLAGRCAGFLLRGDRFAKPRRVIDGFARLGRSPRVLAVTGAWSLSAQLLTIAAGVLAARGLGIDAPLLLLLAVLPVVWLATMIPVSFGGLGLRETALVALLASHGVPEAQCLLFGMVLSLLYLGQGAVGGFFFWITKAPPRSPGPAAPPSGPDRGEG